MDIDLPPNLYLPDLPTRWLATLDARWCDLEASQAARDANAADLLEEAQRFAEACEQLRPIMQPNPEMSVRQALAAAEGGPRR